MPETMRVRGADARRSQRGRLTGTAALTVVAIALLANCTTDPPKGEALKIVQRDVRAFGLCTISADILSSFKTQYRTKATCIPLSGASPKAEACMDTLVRAGITQEMPASYMVEWPDEVATAGLDLIPAYDRKARNLIFKRCIAATEALRVGSIECARAEFTKVTSVKKTGEGKARIYVKRDLAFRPDLETLEKACGPLSRPPEIDTMDLVKKGGGWSVQKTGGD